MKARAHFLKHKRSTFLKGQKRLVSPKNNLVPRAFVILGRRRESCGDEVVQKTDFTALGALSQIKISGELGESKTLWSIVLKMCNLVSGMSDNNTRSPGIIRKLKRLSAIGAA